MLTKKGDEFFISDYSKIQEIQIFIKQNLNIRIEELYSLYVYVQILSQSKFISFPIHIIKCEHPDFVLDQQIGLEIVKSATQREEHAVNKMKKEYPIDSMLEITPYVPGSKGDIREGIREPSEHLKGSGFGDHGKENAWLDCIVQRLNEKTCLLNKKHFLRYQSNQLIIYDNTSYFPDIDYVIPKLQKDYKPSDKFVFDHVYIIMNVMRSFIVDVFGKWVCFNISSEL